MYHGNSVHRLWSCEFYWPRNGVFYHTYSELLLKGAQVDSAINLLASPRGSCFCSVISAAIEVVSSA